MEMTDGHIWDLHAIFGTTFLLSIDID